MHIVVLCPLRVALLESDLKRSIAVVVDGGHDNSLTNTKPTPIKRCCCGLCCRSTIGARCLYYVHLLLMGIACPLLVAMPFFRCCEEGHREHNQFASMSLNSLAFSLIVDVCACTQALRAAGRRASPRLLRSARWGVFCLVNCGIFGFLWTAKRWICNGDDYDRGMCHVVFASEWLSVAALLAYFLPFAWMVDELAEPVLLRGVSTGGGGGGPSTSTSKIGVALPTVEPTPEFSSAPPSPPGVTERPVGRPGFIVV